MDTFFRRRLVCTFYLLTVLFIPLVIHLGFIQLAKGGYYTAGAMKNDTREVALESFVRGQILDRNLRPLSGGYKANRLVVFPQIYHDPGYIAGALAPIIGEDPEKILPYLTGEQRFLPHSLTPQQSEEIKGLNLPGLMVLPVEQRYGSRPLAAHVVGHLGRIESHQEMTRLGEAGHKRYAPDDWVGKTGLEKYYEGELKGTTARGYARILVDAKGKWLPGSGPEVDTGVIDPGRRNVVTTIDLEIQKKVEDIMDAHIKSGAVIVMDVPTGEILAMASRPLYYQEPGRLQQQLSESSEDIFLDQGIGLYHPGSIFKLVIAIAALSEGLAEPDTLYECHGAGDELIKCWYPEGHGKITLADAIAHSCNPSMARLALELGPDLIIKYARALGLDNQNIRGYPYAGDKRQDLDLIAAPHNLVNSSIGQGPVLASPVQVTALMNTLANNGIYREPQLVKYTAAESGEVVSMPEQHEGERVIDEETAYHVKEMLKGVTTRGVGNKALLQDVGSAGKTGSAETGRGKDSIDAWFSGYAPLADNPKYTITILVRDGKSGGDTAAPIFKELMQSLL